MPDQTVMKRDQALRTIAFFRALRGAMVATAGMLTYLGGYERLQPQLVGMFRDPEILTPQVSHWIYTFMGHVENFRKPFLALCAVWAAFLLIQAYGLWYSKRWSIWLGFATSLLVCSVFSWVLISTTKSNMAWFAMVNLGIASYLFKALKRT